MQDLKMDELDQVNAAALPALVVLAIKAYIVGISAGLVIFFLYDFILK